MSTARMARDGRPVCLVAVLEAPPSSACESRRRDQRLRKKTEAIR
jgi:hypothetical protein